MDSCTSESLTVLTTENKISVGLKVLFRKEDLFLGWRNDEMVSVLRKPPPIGIGFLNFKNSCFVNAVLQALFHVPVFVNWVITDQSHRILCQEFKSNPIFPNCIVCLVRLTLKDYLQKEVPIMPKVLFKLTAISSDFSFGVQQDAHEFLGHLLEAMVKDYLTPINGHILDNKVKETNPIGQMFGGEIRTQVTCANCKHISTTFQTSTELQLDIEDCSIEKLENALDFYFREEWIGEYKCEKCEVLTSASKQFSLEVPPLVLCLHLKRFTIDDRKISKRIYCSKMMNMNKYRSDPTAEEEVNYRLTAMVNHLGSSVNYGHYTAIAEACDECYYKFDDDYVNEIHNPNYLTQGYIIMYEMVPESFETPPESPEQVTSEEE